MSRLIEEVAGWAEEEDDDDDEDVDDTGEDTFLEGALAMDAVPFDTGIAKSSTVLGKVCCIRFQRSRQERERERGREKKIFHFQSTQSYYGNILLLRRMQEELLNEKVNVAPYACVLYFIMIN